MSDQTPQLSQIAQRIVDQNMDLLAHALDTADNHPYKLCMAMLNGLAKRGAEGIAGQFALSILQMQLGACVRGVSRETFMVGIRKELEQSVAEIDGTPAMDVARAVMGLHQ